MARMDRVYASKIDGWLGVVIGFALLVPPLAILTVAVVTHQLFLIPVGFLPVVLIPLVAIPVNYRLTDRELIVRAGLIRMRVPYDKISRVEPSRNPLSAPALSLDRIKITYGRAATMVSPADRYNFLADLKRLAQLKGDGDVLTR